MPTTDTLGCGKYEAYFLTRGGEQFVCRARNITQLSWGRKLNDFSEASITIGLNGLDAECCNCINTINPWEHEMAIYRDGVEVWVGPIVNLPEIDLAKATAQIQARDFSAWYDYRWVEIFGNDKEFEEVDIVEVYEWLLLHGYNKGPWNMQFYTTGPIGLPFDRTYIAADLGTRWGGSFPNIANELRDLAGGGVDFTVVRRVFLYGDLDTTTQPGARFDEKSWSVLPKLAVIGTGMSTETGVGGGNGGYGGYDDDQLWIERPDDEYRAKYGVLQKFYPAPELEDIDTRTLPNAVAQRAYELRKMKREPFTYIKGGTFSANAPVTFDQLIPGRVFHVALTQTCRTVQADYRLYSIQIDYNGETETISPELTPLAAEALRT